MKVDDLQHTTPLQPDACELCGRGVWLTRHHLIPRTLHSRKRVRRSFSRTELLSRILWVCRPCHSKIHASLSEKELAENFHTRERLLEHPEVRRFVEWVSTKPEGFKPKKKARRKR